MILKKIKSKKICNEGEKYRFNIYATPWLQIHCITLEISKSWCRDIFFQGNSIWYLIFILTTTKNPYNTAFVIYVMIFLMLWWNITITVGRKFCGGVGEASRQRMTRSRPVFSVTDVLTILTYITMENIYIFIANLKL